MSDWIHIFSTEPRSFDLRRILTLEKLGAIFNQEIHKLKLTPRRFIIHPEMNWLYMIESDHLAYTQTTKQQRREQIGKVRAEGEIRSRSNFICRKRSMPPMTKKWREKRWMKCSRRSSPKKHSEHRKPLRACGPPNCVSLIRSAAKASSSMNSIRMNPLFGENSSSSSPSMSSSSSWFV